MDTHVWNRVRLLEGRTLHTLNRGKAFTIISVMEDHVLVEIASSKRKRGCGRERIEEIASLRGQPEELRSKIEKCCPGTQRASYLAAILHEIRSGGTP